MESPLNLATTDYSARIWSDDGNGEIDKMDIALLPERISSTGLN